jgi:hypothetical protein
VSHVLDDGNKSCHNEKSKGKLLYLLIVQKIEILLKYGVAKAETTKVPSFSNFQFLRKKDEERARS